MEKHHNIKSLAKFAYFLVFITTTSCIGQVHLPRDISKANKINYRNNKLEIVFEKIFIDSIVIVYNKNIVFKEFVKTIRQIEAAKEFCTIDTIVKGKYVHLIINNNQYKFLPLNGYRYYFVTKFNNKIGITYSNIDREYY